MITVDNEDEDDGETELIPQSTGLIQYGWHTL